MPNAKRRLWATILLLATAMLQAVISSKVSADTVSRAVNPTVFIGGVYGLANLIPRGNVAQMLASGKIGLYEHGVGMAQLTHSQVTALLATWAPTGAAQSGGGLGVAETAEAPLGTSTRSPGYLNVFGLNGVYPDSINMNTGTGSGGGNGTWTAPLGTALPGHTYTGYYTADDLLLFLSALEEARNHGAKNIAPVVSPNDPNQDLDDPFISGQYWAPVRTMAIKGGGIALDVPPNYAFQRGVKYLEMIRQIIQFCKKNQLRSSLIISPWALLPDASGHTGSSGFDTKLLISTMRLVAYLSKSHALPSQWVVENYSAPAQGGTENAPGMDGAPGTLNEVALYLSTIAK